MTMLLKIKILIMIGSKQKILKLKATLKNPLLHKKLVRGRGQNALSTLLKKLFFWE